MGPGGWGNQAGSALAPPCLTPGQALLGPISAQTDGIYKEELEGWRDAGEGDHGSSYRLRGKAWLFFLSAIYGEE